MVVAKVALVTHTPGVSDTPEPKPELKPELKYEQARAELASVVERLESGGGTLEESLALWERGEKLAEICRTWLDGAKARVDSARTRHSDSTAAAAQQ